MHVQILLNTTADAELIKLYEPDTVIIATGSRPFIPPIQGADQDFVVTAHDVLLGKTEPGNRVVVIGGGLVGAETADMLGQQCEQVTIIEMLPQIMKDGEASPTFNTLQETCSMESRRVLSVFTPTAIITVSIFSSTNLSPSFSAVTV